MVLRIGKEARICRLRATENLGEDALDGEKQNAFYDS
jgi:hypothetical protein